MTSMLSFLVSPWIDPCGKPGQCWSRFEKGCYLLQDLKYSNINLYIYINIYPEGQRMFFKPSFGNDCFLERTPVFAYHPASCQDNFFAVVVSVVKLWLRASDVRVSRFTISFHVVKLHVF